MSIHTLNIDHLHIKMSTADALKPLIQLIETNQLVGIEPSILHVIKTCCTIINSSDNIPPKLSSTIQSCLDRVHERLNMGNWKDVCLSDRRSITVLSCFKVITYLHGKKEITDNNIHEAYKIIDNGLLFGAPLSKENGDLLHQCAKILSQFKNNQSLETNKSDTLKNKEPERSHTNTNIKSQHTVAKISCTTENEWGDLNIPSPKLTDNEEFSQNAHFGTPLNKISCPSIEKFNNDFFLKKSPIVLLDCMTHWPALKLWPDFEYLLKKAGHRTVPIELGSKYTDNDWTQKLITIREFISEHIFKIPSTIGYLAQHQLFNQIPELLDDIKIPEYCCLKDDIDTDNEIEEDPDINAWFGPSRTISPLHFDPKHNILAQVVGEKLIVLFSPEDTPNLYRHPDNLLENTAQVDPTDPDLLKFPKFKDATPYYCILKSGEMLYIPPKWWHYVKSLSISFSVSYWWK